MRTAKDFFGVPVKVGDDVVIETHTGFRVGKITELDEASTYGITVRIGGTSFYRRSKAIIAVSPIQKEYPENFI